MTFKGSFIHYKVGILYLKPPLSAALTYISLYRAEINCRLEKTETSTKLSSLFISKFQVCRAGPLPGPGPGAAVLQVGVQRVRGGGQDGDGSGLQHSPLP